MCNAVTLNASGYRQVLGTISSMRLILQHCGRYVKRCYRIRSSGFEFSQLLWYREYTMLGLHQAHSKADWLIIPAQQRNRWQRVAFRSNGWITPANIVSLFGFIVVLVGLVHLLEERYAAALILVVIGRLADVLDGLVAERTGTKSLKGETIDVTLDKLAILGTFIVFIVGGLAPTFLLLLLGLQHLISASIGGYVRLRRNNMHPTRLSKVVMATQWTVLAAYILLHALGTQPDSFIWLDGLFGITLLGGLWVNGAYLHFALQPSKRISSMSR